MRDLVTPYRVKVYRNAAPYQPDMLLDETFITFTDEDADNSAKQIDLIMACIHIGALIQARLKLSIEEGHWGAVILDGMNMWSREITPESSKEILDEFICEMQKRLNKEPACDLLLVSVLVGTPSLKYKNDIYMDLDYD